MKRDKRLCIRVSDADLAMLRALRGTPGFEDAPLAVIVRVLVRREAQRMQTKQAGAVAECAA